MYDHGIRNGLAKFEEIVAQKTGLQTESAEPTGIRTSFKFTLVRGSRRHEILLSHEFVEDVANSRQFQLSLERYLGALDKRLLTGPANQFLTRKGVPLALDIKLPPVSSGAGYWVRVHAHDLRLPETQSIFNLGFTDQQYHFDLRKDPLTREMHFVNTVRTLCDEGTLKFYSTSDRPTSNLKTHPIVLESRASQSDLDIDRFLTAKVFWLAFKQGDKRSQTWIADPWDAQYLGVQITELVRAAQILQVEQFLILDQTQEFASAGDELLRQARAFERPKGSSHTDKDLEGRPASEGMLWDYFISHASEDKDSFVRPLAAALSARGARVWYDEFTLTVGDSLRRMIDSGLKKSRYGIVVLSPAFFEKEWPQKELDGLVAREIDGVKVILPIWHGVGFENVRQYSPILADKYALKSKDPLGKVVEEILKVLP